MLWCHSRSILHYLFTDLTKVLSTHGAAVDN
jgi:hypothetical protein